MTEAESVHQLATSCVSRLLEIGLPENQALFARDAVIAHLENYGARIKGGEWRDRLDAFRTLAPGWDSYGGAPITTAALNTAAVILANPGTPIPCSDGGVQIEWHTSRVNAEIVIQPNGLLANDWNPPPEMDF